MTLFCKDREIIQAAAKKLLSCERNLRFDSETGRVQRNFYKPKKKQKGDYHCDRFPSTYVNPMEVWCNQKNPISGQPKPWSAGVDDDPIKLMTNHITCDSWFTLKICNVPRSWVLKAAANELGDNDFLPGDSKYLRLVNDTAERLVKAAEDTTDSFSVFHGMVFKNFDK